MNKSIKEKTEILIATWSGRSGPGYWGDNDFPSHDGQSISFWLSLRGVVSGDPYSYMNQECRAIVDLGLYVWLDIYGTVSIDLRLHDAGSLTLAEGEHRMKLLRRLHRKGKSNKLPELRHLPGHLLRETVIHEPIHTRRFKRPIGIHDGLISSAWALAGWLE